MIRSQLALAWLLVLVGAAAARAEVTKLEIRSRTPYADGRKFGEVGAYETLRGKAYFAVDPQVAANRTVIDLELAPRNAEGKVEFSTDVEILAPVEPKRGRGALLYDVNNRGNKLAFGQFNSGADEFLMRQGFVVVWSGWIAETGPSPTSSRSRVRMGITPSSARDTVSGSFITSGQTSSPSACGRLTSSSRPSWSTSS